MVSTSTSRLVSLSRKRVITPENCPRSLIVALSDVMSFFSIVAESSVCPLVEIPAPSGMNNRRPSAGSFGNRSVEFAQAGQKMRVAFVLLIDVLNEFVDIVHMNRRG